MTEKERASRLSEGIEFEVLPKIRCDSGDKKTSSVAKETELNEVYGNEYRIPIDCGVLDDYGLLLNFIYLFEHGKKTHQVHKCLKNPKT